MLPWGCVAFAAAKQIAGFVRVCGVFTPGQIIVVRWRVGRVRRDEGGNGHRMVLSPTTE